VAFLAETSGAPVAGMPLVAGYDEIDSGGLCAHQKLVVSWIRKLEASGSGFSIPSPDFEAEQEASSGSKPNLGRAKTSTHSCRKA